MLSTIAHYRIINQLGSGGMGEVYLAEDTRLGRQVALKLLPERYTQDAERVRRFAHEAHAASALSHPNIITIYEIGQADGRHFIAAEFVAGRTLRQELAARRLELPVVFNYAIQIATALVAAHGAGITHRDIKPENVMRRLDGYVKVLDFGLAKLAEGVRREPFGTDPNATNAEAAAGDDHYGTAAFELPKTNPGVILGTLNYMSPEQARGLQVDARTDVFSLGVVLYEMTTGRVPFTGPTTSDLIVAILDREPPPLRRFAPDAPDELEWVVQKALAKERAERYQSVKALLSDLQRLQQRFIYEAKTTRLPRSGMPDWPVEASDEAGLLSDSGRLLSATQSTQSGVSGVIDSLAVLPFVAAGQNADAALLAESLTESLILNLSRLPQLRVMAWSTVARFQGRELDPLTVGRELAVRAVLAGRLLQVGDKLVIKTELIDTADGAQLWGERYQREFADLFTLEEEIAAEIGEKLRLRLNSEERQRLGKRYTNNNEAYQAYLKGRYYWNQRTAKSLRQAVECFQRAIALDDEYALAYAGLADCYCLASIYGAVPPKAVMPRAKAAALRALELDDGLAEAHTSLGAIHAWFDWDWAAAECEFLHAIELNPNYAVARHWYATTLLSVQGRHDESLASELRALALEPFSLPINTHLGFICYHARRYDEAADYLRRALEMDDQFALAHFYLGLTRAQQGRCDEAVAELERASAIAHGGTLIRAALGYIYGVAGRADDARRILTELQTYPTNRDVSPFYLALIYAGLGEKEAALKRLTSAYEEKFSWMVWLKTEPIFDGLRDDARFTELMRGMGLSE